MKLKFELKRPQIEQLYKILKLVYDSIWGHDERIYFYFDSEQLIIYPEERRGFDKVFARISIANVIPAQQAAGAGSFFSSYQIKSMRQRSAILLMPTKLSSFIEDLNVLVNLQYDASFKLTQQSEAEGGAGEKKQFIDIVGSCPQTRTVVRSFVEIKTIFSPNLYPEEIQRKEIDFVVDSATCQFTLAKFAQRFQILSDEEAHIVFEGTEGVEGTQAAQSFMLELNSERMKTTVTNRRFQGSLQESTNAKPKYDATLKKDVFMKFFTPLKMPGQAILKISDQQVVEMEYSLERCNFISVLVEAQSRNN